MKGTWIPLGLSIKPLAPADAQVVKLLQQAAIVEISLGRTRSKTVDVVVDIIVDKMLCLGEHLRKLQHIALLGSGAFFGGTVFAADIGHLSLFAAFFGAVCIVASVLVPPAYFQYARRRIRREYIEQIQETNAMLVLSVMHETAKGPTIGKIIDRGGF